MEPQTQQVVPPSHVVKYIGVLVVGILIGLGSSFVVPRVTPTDIVVGTYQEGFDAAKNRVLESPMGAIFNSPDELRILSGVVTAVNGNRITIHIQPINPFENPALDNRIIVVSTDTKISKLSQVDSKIYQAEMDAFMKKMQSTKFPAQSLVTPAPFTSVTSVVEEIREGDTLSVTASDNIKNTKEFSVSAITIQPKLNTN